MSTTKINFQPLNGKIVIKQDPPKTEETKTESGIIINTGKGKEIEMLSGEVVAVHHECEKVKVGDRVQWQPYRNYPLEVDEETYQVVPEEELHGVFTK